MSQLLIARHRVVARGEDLDGDVVGAVGISGDTADNDEICAIAGVQAAGLTPDPGKEPT